MSRLLDISIAILNWEHNHWRKVSTLVDRGCPPGSVEEVRSELYAVIARQDPELKVEQVNRLLDIELEGFIR